MRHYIIDAGHSGVAFNRFYQTPGKRSPKGAPGILEGQFNRGVAEKLTAILNDEYAVPAEFITPGPMWPTLGMRVKYINYLVSKLKREGDTAIVISIHANAAGSKGWNIISFARMFHAKKASSTSRLLTRSLTEAFGNAEGLPYPVRAPGMLNTPLLTKTKCPAALVECGMMTCKESAAFMASDAAPRFFAGLITRGIMNCP